jgi:hypothetical protein
MLIGRGDFMVFIQRPISAAFLALSLILIATQVYFWLRKRNATGEKPIPALGSIGAPAAVPVQAADWREASTKPRPPR